MMSLGVVRDDHVEVDTMLLLVQNHALVNPVEAVGL